MKKLFGLIVLISISFFVGCGGGNSTGNINTKTISGYVIDDPVANATIEVYDENGTLLAREENATDVSGYYNIKIKSNSPIVRIIAIPKNGTPLDADINLDKDSETYITQYTTALIDDAINENKNPEDIYFSLFNKLAFNQGEPTNRKGYDFQKINYIASKIHASFINKIPYYIYNDTNLTIIPKTLEAGSVIDFSLDGYDNLICNNTSAVTILNNTRLSVAEDLNKTITVNCIAKGKRKFNIYNITLIPTNTTIKDMNASQKSISINGIQINKPSNDSIQVQNANNAPILLKNNSNIIAGNTLLNFYPNGKVLKQPLIVKIPSTKQNQTFYLLSKDGSLEKADSTYSNGIYDVTVPHFTKLIQINDNIVQTSTNIVNNKDYKDIKNLLIEKDKNYYTFSDSLSYPSLLTSHGYSEDDLQNNINVESLLAILLLHNGKGIIDFDGTNVNFNGGTLKFGITTKKDETSQESNLLVDAMIKLLQIKSKIYAINEQEAYEENIGKYRSAIEIYKKTLKDLYDNMKKNMKAYNAYRKKLNDIELEYQTSLKTYTDIKNALNEYDKLVNEVSKASYNKGSKKYNILRLTLYVQIRFLEKLSGKSLDYINHHRKDFLKILESEVQKTKTLLDNFKKNNNPLKISNKARFLIQNLYEDVKNGTLSTNKLASFIRETKNLQLLQESHLGDNFAKFFSAIGFAFKVWDAASTYNFKEIDNKIKFLNYLEVYLPNYKKEIDDLKSKLINAKFYNEHYLSSIYAYLNNEQGIIGLMDFSNDLYGMLTLSSKFTNWINKKIGIIHAADNIGSILDILNTLGQACGTWQGFNGLAYMSATASTLAYQLANNPELTPKEQLNWYCLFQTISAASLRSWYYYAADKAININKSYILNVLGNMLNVGLSIISNPTPLGFADAAVKSVFSDIYISMVAQAQHGINTGITQPFHGYFSLEDEQISDIVSRTAEYKNIVNGVLDSVFSHKRALIVPITQVIQLPNGNKLFSLYIKGNDIDRIAIRFDRNNSNTYMEDIANNAFTEAAEKGYYLNSNNIYAKHMFGNNAPSQRAGMLFNPDQKNGTLVTVAVGRNVDRMEILGWKTEGSIKSTIPYSHIINIIPTLNINSSRINNIETDLLDKINFDNPNSQNNLKYLLSNKFTIIDLDNNTTINNLQTLSRTTDWIALKYYNSQMYSIALLKDKNKLYYFIRDNIFNKNSGDMEELFGGSIDFAKMFTLKYPIASLVNDIDIASRGAFSAVNLDDLFPNLEKGIKNIESLYENHKPSTPQSQSQRTPQSQSQRTPQSQSQRTPQSQSQHTLFPGHYPGMWPNQCAFAVIRKDGTVVTWGYPACEWDSSSVQDKLSNAKVVSIYSTSGAFAALTDDGKVIIWGNSGVGGDSSSVQDELSNAKVVAIYSTYDAFAALTDDGKVITWGDPDFGGDSSSVQNKLSNAKVVSIYSTEGAFAALTDDGKVITWGHPNFGGDSSSVQNELSNAKVVSICSNDQAFAALTDDGKVITWGAFDEGGDSSSVQNKLSNAKVVAIYSTYDAFAALTDDGKVITWGDPNYGGDSSSVQNELSNAKVVAIYSTYNAFAALTDDGKVITWGNPNYGGDSSSVQDKLSNAKVVSIYSTSGAFAALTDDGKVITWGDPDFGGDSSSVQDKLSNAKVVSIYSTDNAFAALTDDGKVITWGNPGYGGDSSSVQDELSNAKVVAIYSTESAFAALTDDGKVITWGDPNYGGNSSSVQSKLHDVVGFSPSYIWPR